MSNDWYEEFPILFVPIVFFLVALVGVCWSFRWWFKLFN